MRGIAFVPSLSLVVVACGLGDSTASDGGADGGPSCVEPAYPGGPYGTAVGDTLSDRTWTGASVAGELGSVAIKDAIAGCPGDPPVLVVRLDAAWCGTCRSDAAHSSTLLGSDVGGRVRLFDVVLYDADNAPATADDATAWQANEDVATETAVDPAQSALDLVPASTPLPFMVVLDATTMTIRDTLSNPTEDALEQSARTVLARIDGVTPPAAPAPVLFEGRFSRDQWNLIQSMAFTDPPPPDPSNAVADSIPAAAVGGKLFADLRLSPSDTVACSSCHQSARQYADGFPTSADGVGRVTRNAPSLIFAAYTPWKFWDGRADSLWSQALGPTEAPNEMGSSRLFIAHTVYSFYEPQYEAIFGPMPPLSDTTRFPPSGLPGDAAYDGMSASDQQAVTQVFVNVGKSIEAFERTFRGAGAALDSYAAGETSVLTDPQKDGLLAFLQSGCAQCHWGPRLTDDAFHVLRFPTGVAGGSGDPGRQAGIPELDASSFDLGSVWSDAPSMARPSPTPGAWTVGAFKTPQLRNVALTPPYGHGGNYAQLSDVVELIRTGGLPAGSALAVGTTERWLVPFDASNDAPIVTFLDSLDMGVAH